MPFVSKVLQVRVASTGIRSTRAAVDRLGGSIGGLSKKAGLAGAALGALAVGGLARSVGAARDLEEAMNTLAKVTSEDIAAELRSDIIEMATEVRLSQEELADLAAQAARFGAEGPEEIRRFTRVAAEMGAATTLASDEAGKALAKTAAALNEPLDNARELGDGINELSNRVESSSSEIVDSTQRAGATLTELGLKRDEIIGLSGAMNANAASSARAATMMRQMGEAMLDPDNVEFFARTLGVTTEEFIRMRDENPNETLRELGEALNESEKASAELRQELNNRQARAFTRFAQNTDDVSESQEIVNQAIQKGGSLAAENAQDVATLSGQYDIMKSEIRGVAADTGQNLIPVLTRLVSGVSDNIENFAEWNRRLGGMPALIILLGGVTVGLVSILGLLATVMSASLIPGLGLLAGGFAAAGSAAAAATAPTAAFGGAVALATSPVILLTALILGLLAIMAILALRGKELADRWHNVWQQIKFSTINAWRDLQNFLIGGMESLGNRFVSWVNDRVDNINFFIEQLNRLLDAIPRVESELDTLDQAAEIELERAEELDEDDLADMTREVREGEGLTDIEDRFRGLFETPEFETDEEFPTDAEDIDESDLPDEFSPDEFDAGDMDMGRDFGDGEEPPAPPATVAAGPEDTVSVGGTDTAVADDTGTPSTTQTGGRDGLSADAIRRAIDGATLLLEGDDGETQEATVQTDGTRQTREARRLGRRNPNI